MTIPQHIAIIMDGNGRWATNKGLSRDRGHAQGVKALERTLDAAFQAGVFTVSIYAFSTENWSRPQKEIDKLFDILRDYLKNNVKRMEKEGIRLSVMGEMSKLPLDLQSAVTNSLTRTAQCKSHVLNIGLNYGGRAEIVRAFNGMIADGVKVADETTLAKYLYTSGLADPDLMIRTSGEQRLSNFMLYQSAYSELYFTETLWPDFDGAELDKAFEWFSARKRNFGALPKGGIKK